MGSLHLSMIYYIKTKSRLSGLSVLAALITLPSRDVSTPDLLEMKAKSSGINKFVSKSF